MLSKLMASAILAKYCIFDMQIYFAILSIFHFSR